MFAPFNNQMNNQNNYQEERAGRLASSDFQTLQKARRDLIGEIQAIIDYDEHIYTSTNEVARQTWSDIKNEEIVHVGELLALLNYLDPAQKPFVEEGINEFGEITGQSNPNKK
ncbi:MAG: hypothetical protein EOM55_02555 [Clostridia bacterium]|nr:hypothetical protein [Clostridia bacterium]